MDNPLPDLQPDWALFFDIDGTLLEIAAAPEAVRVDGALLACLDRLHAASGGALALLSGRSLVDIDRLFAPLALSAAGVHGAERRRGDGTVERPTAADGGRLLAALREPLGRFAARHRGLWLEDKGLALALHFRQAPEHEGEVLALVAELTRGHADGLRVVSGKMVVEIQPCGADKGRAVAAFMAEAPFRGRRPFVAGDDVTDEDGFRMANELGGISLRVGDSRESAARCRLPSVAALRRWLGAGCETHSGLRGGPAG